MRKSAIRFITVMVLVLSIFTSVISVTASTPPLQPEEYAFTSNSIELMPTYVGENGEYHFEIPDNPRLRNGIPGMLIVINRPPTHAEIWFHNLQFTPKTIIGTVELYNGLGIPGNPMLIVAQHTLSAVAGSMGMAYREVHAWGRSWDSGVMRIAVNGVSYTLFF